jgi:hypothetical protein
LLNGLIEQIRRTPPTCEIVVREKLMSIDDVLSVMEAQITQGTDFQSAAERLRLWTAAIDTAVSQWISMMRIPIGQILVEQGQVTFEAMVSALNEFLDLKEDPKPEPAPVPAAAPAPDAKAPTLMAVSPLFLGKYQEFFTEDRLRQIEALFGKLQSSVGQSQEAVRRSLEHISQEVHEMKEIVRFINAGLSTRILLKLVRTIDFFLDNPGFLDPGTAQKLAAIGPQVAGILRGLRTSLVQSGSERGYWSQQGGVFTHFENELSRFVRE